MIISVITVLLVVIGVLYVKYNATADDTTSFVGAAPTQSLEACLNNLKNLRTEKANKLRGCQAECESIRKELNDKTYIVKD